MRSAGCAGTTSLEFTRAARIVGMASGNSHFVVCRKLAGGSRCGGRIDFRCRNSRSRHECRDGRHECQRHVCRSALLRNTRKTGAVGVSSAKRGHACGSDCRSWQRQPGVSPFRSRTGEVLSGHRKACGTFLLSWWRASAPFALLSTDSAANRVQSSHRFRWNLHRWGRQILT